MRLRLQMAAAVVLALVAVADARSARLRVAARLREAPSAASELLGWIPAGTRVDVLGDRTGWREVRTPDGKTGYIWYEHLVEGDAEAATPPATAPAVAPTPAPETASGAPRSIAEEVRALRGEVEKLRQRPTPATAADLERVRAEVERLVSAHRDLARRIDDRMVPPGLAPESPPASAFGPAPIMLLLGAVLGFIGSRLAQRRRDTRQRGRLRI